jgi:hypothetical protein
MGELERWSKRLLPNLPYRRIEQDTSFQNRITIGAATGTCSAGLQPIFVLPLVFPQVRKSTIPPSLFESRALENDAY